METAANQLRTPDLPVETTVFDDGGNADPGFTPSPQPAAAQNAEPDDERPEPQAWKDEKRAEIFARAREKRAAEAVEFSGDPNDPNALYGADVDQSDMGELEKEAIRRRQEHLQEIAQGKQPQQGQQRQGKPLNGLDPELLAKPVPIIVDGQQIEVPIEDLVRNYQIDRAADKRFEQARALLQQTQQFQRGQPQPGQGAEYDEPLDQDAAARQQDAIDQGDGNTSRRPANVKDLVEKIQLGNADEAAQALEEFITSAANRAAPVDETTRVLTALEDHNARQAVLSFAEQNPQIANNPILQQAATAEIHRGMAEDLLRAGYTMDQLRQVAPTPQQLTQLHKQARINRVKGVRQVSDLVNAGYQGALSNLRSLVDQTPRNAAPNQVPGMQQRQQRKESLQPQPAARRLSPGLQQQTPARSQEQSRSAAVAKMRQARGQPT